MKIQYWKAENTWYMMKPIHVKTVIWIFSGRVSLRLRRDGKAAVTEMPSDFDITANKSIDDLLEVHLGIRDCEMATTIVESFKEHSNHLADFSIALKDKLLVDLISENEKLLYAIWKVLGDLKKSKGASMTTEDLQRSSNFEDDSDWFSF